MSIYVLQVRSGKEEAVCRMLHAAEIAAFAPIKKVFLRRGGKWHEETKPIFPQYVFVQSPFRNPHTYQIIRRTDGFVRFLGDNIPQSISKKEEAWILWLRNGGKPVGVSRVLDTQGGVKLVLDGALRHCPEADYEIEYQLRQRRAVVRITLMGRKHKITLPVMPV